MQIWQVCILTPNVCVPCHLWEYVESRGDCERHIMGGHHPGKSEMQCSAGVRGTHATPCSKGPPYVLIFCFEMTMVHHTHVFSPCIALVICYTWQGILLPMCAMCCLQASSKQCGIPINVLLKCSTCWYSSVPDCPNKTAMPTMGCMAPQQPHRCNMRNK